MRLHDVGLVDGSDTVTTSRLGVVECITSDTLRSVPGNELDGLDNSVNNLGLQFNFRPSVDIIKVLPHVQYQSIHPRYSHGSKRC